MTQCSLLSVLSSLSRPLVDKHYSNKNVEIIARLSKRLGSHFQSRLISSFLDQALGNLKALTVYIPLLMKAICDKFQDNFATTNNLQLVCNGAGNTIEKFQTYIYSVMFHFETCFHCNTCLKGRRRFLMKENNCAFTITKIWNFSKQNLHSSQKI